MQILATKKLPFGDIKQFFWPLQNVTLLLKLNIVESIWKLEPNLMLHGANSRGRGGIWGICQILYLIAYMIAGKATGETGGLYIWRPSIRDIFPIGRAPLMAPTRLTTQ